MGLEVIREDRKTLRAGSGWKLCFNETLQRYARIDYLFGVFAALSIAEG